MIIVKIEQILVIDGSVTSILPNRNKSKNYLWSYRMNESLWPVVEPGGTGGGSVGFGTKTPNHPRDTG